MLLRCSPVAVQAELSGAQAAHHESCACRAVSQTQVAQLLLKPSHTRLRRTLHTHMVQQPKQQQDISLNPNQPSPSDDATWHNKAPSSKCPGQAGKDMLLFVYTSYMRL